MYPVRAKKHLGQHFLKDDTIAEKIADSLSGSAQQVLEVGPGTGVLTKFLLSKKIENLKVVEIDRESVEFLRMTFPGLEGRLIEGDFLEMELMDLFDGSFSIIGNFPYNISSQIFFKALEYRSRIDEVVGMLQQEVAQRIAAGPGSKTYGILSVLLQTWFQVEYLFTVPSSVFIPPPKVTSAVIRLRRIEEPNHVPDPELFFKVVKTAFNQRRKTLHNALKPIAIYNGEYAGKRAEQLSVQQFLSLTHEIRHLLSQG